jgi:hypothetical protein
MLRENLARAVSAMRGHTARWVQTALRIAIGVPRHIRQRAGLLWAFRRPLMVAMGVGMLVGFAVAWTPSWVSATLTGVGTACLSLVVQAGLWARRSMSAILAG